VAPFQIPGFQGAGTSDIAPALSCCAATRKMRLTLK
jgi:hypothetical protein